VNVFYKKFNPVNRRQSEVLVNPKQDPFFQHFPEFFSTLFKCLCIRVNTITFANLSIVAAIIRQDLVLCTAKCRLNIFQQHPETSNPV